MTGSSGVGKRTARYFVIFFHYFTQYMKTQMAYRADFVANVFSELFQQSVNLIFIAVVFTKVPRIQGWSRDEILFIYGFFLIPFGI
ncbi:MAG TPA: ABC-2 family transporter protein, partial [Desulfobacteria bacterium]|nr:ABC-2 family transporter protein [Desulfobacteria bacterium]